MRHLNFSAYIVLLSLALAAQGVRAQEKPFDLSGVYLEGCSCKLVCACDLNGEMAKGCQVIGAAIVSSGTYGDADVSGTKIAFAVGDKWVRTYIQASDPARTQAAESLAKALFSSYGAVETVTGAEIDLSGSDGNYTLTVNGGAVLELKTQPVIGADNKTAVTYTNYPDPLFHTIMQGRVVSGSYNDGEHHFTLEGSNSFFNQNWSASGKA
jgi:hypothetical protein